MCMWGIDGQIFVDNQPSLHGCKLRLERLQVPFKVDIDQVEFGVTRLSNHGMSYACDKGESERDSLPTALYYAHR
ncbi:hypothetical protein HAX54_004378, partial [Datura stramonium]|nr:hypothetical protein [Datura stramonium]